jgi:citronellol/citronellal dehydrogenase
MLMSGGSRGIGLAIALRAARDGANVVLLAKTDQPDARLPGTVHTAAAEIEAAGGRALAVVGDVRQDADVARAVDGAVRAFGKIDIVVSNASAIALAPVGELPLKRYDLMMDINARGTFCLLSLALPHLYEAGGGHILTMSPPLNPDPRWLAAHAAYTISKYSMTMLTLGVAGQAHPVPVSANCLWPATTIATAAIQNLLGGQAAMSVSRRPEIMADAAYQLLSRAPGEITGQTYIDEDVLRDSGVTDFAPYRYESAAESDLQRDIFLS